MAKRAQHAKPAQNAKPAKQAEAPKQARPGRAAPTAARHCSGAKGACAEVEAGRPRGAVYRQAAEAVPESVPQESGPESATQGGHFQGPARTLGRTRPERSGPARRHQGVVLGQPLLGMCRRKRHARRPERSGCRSGAAGGSGACARLAGQAAKDEERRAKLARVSRPLLAQQDSAAQQDAVVSQEGILRSQQGVLQLRKEERAVQQDVAAQQNSTAEQDVVAQQGHAAQQDSAAQQGNAA